MCILFFVYWKDRICWICNAIEPADKLVTCCRCKRSTEHTCCMRNKHFGTRVFWYCGECLSTRDTVNRRAEEARPPQELGDGRSKFKKLKRSAKQSDTSTSTRSPRPANSRPVVQKSLCCAADSTKNSSKGKDVMVDSSQRQLIKPPSSNYISSDTCKARQTKLLAPEEVTRLNSSKRSSLHGCMNRLSCRSNKRKFLLPPISRRKSISVYPSTSMNNVFKDTSKTIERSTDALCLGSSLKCITRNDSDWLQKMKDSGTVCCYQEKDLPVALVINGYGKHSQRAFWKGDFDVFHVVSHGYSGIQAHLPGEVSIKVYDTSKHLPKTLQFKTLPRKDVWPKAFLLEPPTEKDIGLYFFPCATERHKEKYVRLLERLNLGDRALKTSVDGVQLLVFLSNQLPAEVQRLDGETYLWGVFRHLKHKKSRSPELVQISPCRTDAIMKSNNCASSDTSFEGKHKTLDMEGNREIQNPDLNYVTPSSVKIPSENVSKPIDPDAPSGVSSLLTPRVSGCSSSKHPSSSHKTTCEGSMPSRINSGGDIVATTVGYTQTASKPHQVQQKCLNLQKADASLHTSSGFLEPNSRASNNVKTSVTKVPLKKVSKLIDPRIYGPFRLQNCQHLNRSHETSSKEPMPSRMDSSSHIAATTVGGYIPPALKPHQVPKCHSLEENSKGSNNVNSSAVKVPLKNATNSIEPDAASGSSLRTPGLSGIPSFQHPNSSSNFLEPNSRASNNVKTSVTKVPLKKVSKLIDPRISGPFRLPSSQHSNRSHETSSKETMPPRMDSSSHIAATTVGGYIPPALKPHQVPKCHSLEENSKGSNNVNSSAVKVPLKNATNSIEPDAASGSSLRTPGLSGIPSFQHPNSSQGTNFKCPVLPRMESRGHVAATNEVQPRCNQAQSVFPGLGTRYVQEPNSRDSNYVRSSFVEPISKITNPISQYVRPGFSKFGPPGFPELASYQHPSSSSQAIRMDPMSPIMKYGRYEHSITLGGYPPRHEVQPNFHQVDGPVYQDIRPGFSKFGPPAFPPLPSCSTRPSSSPAIPSEAAWSSRLDRRGHLTSTIAGGYAAPASQVHEVQPNCLQMPGGPHHPVFRPEFPNFPSRTTGRGHVSSTTVRGYATAASQQNKMHPNYPQGPPTARSNNEL